MKRYSELKNFIGYYIASFIFEFLFNRLHEHILVKIDFFDRNYVVNKIYIVFMIALIFLAPLRTFTETKTPSPESARAVLNSKWKPLFVVLYLIFIYFLCWWLVEESRPLIRFSDFEFRVDLTQMSQLVVGFLYIYILALVSSNLCYPLVVIIAKYIWGKKYEQI